jgi:hypothetical protein
VDAAAGKKMKSRYLHLSSLLNPGQPASREVAAILLGMLLPVIALALPNDAVLHTSSGMPPEAGARSSAPDAKVSYSPPPGWKAVAVPEARYKVVTGPPNSGFVPNISISEAEYPGTVEEFVSENVKNMKSQAGIFRIVSQNSFNSNAGVKGIKLVY